MATILQVREGQEAEETRHFGPAQTHDLGKATAGVMQESWCLGPGHRGHGEGGKSVKDDPAGGR